MGKINLFWHRRDLRFEDNTGLSEALASGVPTQPIFIFDLNILEDLEDKDDRRVSFIFSHIERLKKEAQSHGSSVWVFYGKPVDVFKALIEEHEIAHVYANGDYEPYAYERDKAIREILAKKDIELKLFKDHVIFHKHDIVKDDGDPYVVYSPYAKKWKAKLEENHFSERPSIQNLNKLNLGEQRSTPSLAEMGFKKHDHDWPDKTIDLQTIDLYDKQRDIPAKRGTSRISVHLRFGTVSIRSMVKIALKHNEKWLNELIWRDFYQSILFHFPRVVKDSFRQEYDQIAWRNNEEEFERWCEGKTGYPIVDAGMRELNTTGFMHNRVRMIVASFLTKHLLIDWRWGEAYFARKLLDYELASNNGGWQWAAGSGVDAAPYFRVFNPYLQTDKFDPDKAYIKKWVEEYDTEDYPKPIVEHKKGRERALETYKQALSK